MSMYYIVHVVMMVIRFPVSCLTLNGTHVLHSVICSIRITKLKFGNVWRVSGPASNMGPDFCGILVRVDKT